jgi:hypothetical protein
MKCNLQKWVVKSSVTEIETLLEMGKHERFGFCLNIISILESLFPLWWPVYIQESLEHLCLWFGCNRLHHHDQDHRLNCPKRYSFTLIILKSRVLSNYKFTNGKNKKVLFPYLNIAFELYYWGFHFGGVGGN